MEFPVGVLADPGQHQERAFPADVVTLHQDALGLPDQVAADHGFGELGLLPDAGVGDGGMGGEEEPDLFGLVVECVGCAGVEVQCAEVVAFDV